uniref:Uncharacterized protein n=1 Tax=Arundo donax TaxID=35708 RepID=A0A0A9GSG9_ARUDO
MALMVAKKQSAPGSTLLLFSIYFLQFSSFSIKCVILRLLSTSFSFKNIRVAKNSQVRCFSRNH